jgi:hypothetical protein
MNPEWYKDFPWGKWDPVSWWNNVALLALVSRAGWTQTLEVGVGQYCNGIYLFGMRAKQLGCRHTAIDISPTNLGRAKQVIARYDLPVDLLEFDSKAVAWGRRMQLIYIDGGHSYAQVMGDIANFCRWIARSGLMVFDDYGKKHLEVTQAVDDAIKGYESAFEMSTFPAQAWAVWRRR